MIPSRLLTLLTPHSLTQHKQYSDIQRLSEKVQRKLYLQKNEIDNNILASGFLPQKEWRQSSLSILKYSDRLQAYTNHLRW